MKRYALIGVMLCLPAMVQAAEEVAPRLLQGQGQLLARDYAAALATFRSLEEEFPESPAGPFGIMATWQLRMFENRDFQYVGSYTVAMRKMEARCEKRLFPEHPDDWDLLVCGAGYGMKSFFDVRQEKWLRALSNAQRSIRSFRRLLWQNPQFIDADMGIGGYEFWRSVETQKYKWLPFFTDQRATGMAKVERVVREGKYVQDLARANLAYMQLELKQHDAGLQNLRLLLAKYPNNILLKQSVGDVMWSLKKYPECAAIFSEILKKDPSQTRSLYWMAASSIKPYLKPDAKGEPNAEMKLPEEVAVRAKSQLEQYLKSRPIQAWAAATHYWLGAIAECQGDHVTAIAEYETAVQIDKDGAKDSNSRLARLKR